MKNFLSSFRNKFGETNHPADRGPKSATVCLLCFTKTYLFKVLCMSADTGPLQSIFKVGSYIYVLQSVLSYDFSWIPNVVGSDNYPVR